MTISEVREEFEMRRNIYKENMNEEMNKLNRNVKAMSNHLDKMIEENDKESSNYSYHEKMYYYWCGEVNRVEEVIKYLKTCISYFNTLLEDIEM